jgi:phosphohistidine phosphatase SixA
MIVGHNPTMTEFLNKLVGATTSVELKKGAVARVEKEGRKAAILKWCMPPKVIRSIQQASASSSRPKTVSK